MKSPQVAIVCASGAFAIWSLSNAGTQPWVYVTLFVCAATAAAISARYFAAARKAAIQHAATEDQRQLIDEYRRLADLAVTAQEHTDLKLGDMSVRIDHLMEQMTSLQSILKEVE